jgi:hypothetical protein
MINALELAILAQLPEPLLTVYLNTNPGLPSNCRSIPGYVAWLKTEAKNLRTHRGESKNSLLYQQILRVEKYLGTQRPEHTGVVIFAGPEVWQVIPLQVEPSNELHWGKPHLWQLNSIMGQHRPACAVVLDLSGARLYEYASGRLTQFAEQPFKIDVSHWRQKEREHMAKQGTRMPHGAQRDLFEHRFEAEYVHLLRDVAKAIAAYCDAHSIDEVYLLGSDRLTKQVQLGLPQRLREQVALIAHVSTEEPAADIEARIEARLKEYEKSRKEHNIDDLLNRPRGIVTGVEQTLNQLQRGHLASLVLVEGLNPVLHHCGSCGLTTASASQRCPTCDGIQTVTTLHEMLPMLLIRHSCEMELVEGVAASHLQTAGGIGGRLRTLKHQPAVVTRAQTAKKAGSLAHLA